ncbi:hypothetical protein [Streptomyces sp. NPDC051310]|uniref:hypothetical protein n=1 Tax=Streptomyces sp. NPDC051310 TaxID=3365649 RepID=UPI0037B3000E
MVELVRGEDGGGEVPSPLWLTLEDGRLVGEHLPAPGGGEGVDPLFELLPASRRLRVPDLDLGSHQRLGDEKFGMADDVAASPGRAEELCHNRCARGPARHAQRPGQCPGRAADQVGQVQTVRDIANCCSGADDVGKLDATGNQAETKVMSSAWYGIARRTVVLPGSHRKLLHPSA